MDGVTYTSTRITSATASITNPDAGPGLVIGLNGSHSHPSIHFHDPASARELAAVLLAGADDLETAQAKAAVARNRAAA